MKVLLLTPSLERPGGIQRYTLTLAQALKDLMGDQFARCVSLAENSVGQSTPRPSARSKWRLGWQAVLEAARWRPDIIICAHLALAPVGWLLATLARRPYWVVVYGIQAWVPLIEAWVPLPFAKGTALRRADRVIVISEFSREQVTKRQRVKAERVVCLPCALDEGLKTIEPASIGPHRSIANGQRVVLTVARMEASEQYKGHDVILRALHSVLSRVSDVVYVVVGEGDDRPRIEALVDELGLRPHVIFTGRVSDSELVALYNRSDVFALPARTVITSHEAKGEGFGIVFLEAMAFGKPVIGPNFGAPAEFIRDGENGLLVDPTSVASVAEALLALLIDPEKGRELGRAGREWVRTMYSYGSFCERLRELLPSSPKMI
jgi:glycosyltransferase involved in cell wall biosynthesis